MTPLSGRSTENAIHRSGDAPQQHFEGHDGRECGKHRTTGGRAWCFDCTEWCYPEAPCRGCYVPQLEAENEQLRAALRAIRDRKTGPDHRIAVEALGDHHA